MLISDFNKTKSPFGVNQKGTGNKQCVSLMTTVCNNHKNLIIMVSRFSKWFTYDKTTTHVAWIITLKTIS